MSDLDDRLRVLDTLPRRDLWPSIVDRTPHRGLDEPGPWHRVGVAVLALVVAAAGIGLAWRVLGKSSITLPTEPVPITPKANGLIAFACWEGWPSTSDICVVEPDGTGLRTLVTGVQLMQPSWSPNGRRLLYQDGGGPDSGGATIWVVNADGSDRAQVIDSDRRYDRMPDWSPDGRLIVVSGDGDLFVTRADGSGSFRLTDTPGEEWLPDWSPDGQSVAYVAEMGPGDPDFDLYTIDLTGQTVTSLTSTPDAQEWSPDWSPDGSSLAFRREIGSNEQRESQVVIVRADGTGERVVYACEERCGAILDLAWSPDGTQIVFSVGTEVGQDIEYELFLVNVDGTGARQLTSGANAPCCPSWQPLPVQSDAPQ